MRFPLRSLQPAYFAALHRVLLLRARDAGDDLGAGSLLVIAPHPDDETLACGATILRATRAGREVHVVVVCDGRHSHQSSQIPAAKLAEIRRREVDEACRRLGVAPDRVIHLGHEDRHVAGEARAVAEELDRIVQRVRPDVVLVPSGIDKHPDHRAIHAIVCRLWRRGRLPHRVFEYPVWFWTGSTWMTPGSGPILRAVQLITRSVRTAMLSRPVAVRCDDLLKQKRHALEAFESQMRSLTGEANWPVLDERFLASFFRSHELFFPLLRAGAPEIPQPGDDPYAIRSGGLSWGWAVEGAR